MTEGVITRVDRARGEIRLRFADGRSETLQLTARAAAESAATPSIESDAGTKVVVYSTDEAGRPVVHPLQEGFVNGSRAGHC
jgi:hypothetical protein